MNLKYIFYIKSYNFLELSEFTLKIINMLKKNFFFNNITVCKSNKNNITVLRSPQNSKQSREQFKIVIIKKKIFLEFYALKKRNPEFIFRYLVKNINFLNTEILLKRKIIF
jgi:ribosomal protein S10